MEDKKYTALIVGAEGERVPPAPTSHSPWSRIIQPGKTACDAFPRCRFAGQGEALRDHMRECEESEAGQLYRVLLPEWLKRHPEPDWAKGVPVYEP